jgi:hypothetical protein
MSPTLYERDRATNCNAVGAAGDTVLNRAGISFRATKVLRIGSADFGHETSRDYLAYGHILPTASVSREPSSSIVEDLAPT